MSRLSATLLLCLVAVLAGCGGGHSKTRASKAPDGATTVDAQASVPRECRPAAKPKPKDSGGQKKPKAELDASKQWSIDVETNCGSFTIALDVKDSPHTAASLVSLARSGFYEGTTFFRIVPGFVIQGGDPTNSGSGDPGYSTVDRPPAGTKYTRGVVAMAKTNQEPPGTGGSQFFVVTGQDAGLPAEYALVGRVTKGLDVVERIGAAGDPNTEQATAVIVVKGMKVSGG